MVAMGSAAVLAVMGVAAMMGEVVGGREGADMVSSTSRRIAFVPGLSRSFVTAGKTTESCHAAQSRGFRVATPRLRAARRFTVPSIIQLQSQIQFADAVEEVLKLKFNPKSMSRVIKSWRRMDEEFLHKEFVEEVDTYQECNSYIEGLGIKTFYDPYEFEWAKNLRDCASIIQEEFQVRS